MSDGDFIRTRLAEWSGELTKLEVALGVGSPGSEVALAGRALEVCGHLLRRRARSGVGVGSVERVLRALPSGSVSEWLEGADLRAMDARLRRATDEAVEAALPETPGEGETWAAWARQGLEVRDAFESQLVAMRFREGLGLEADRPVRERLAAALEEMDVALSPRSRRLVALNGYRREMRDALDPEHRAAAWWFTSRAECDDLLAVLAGEKTATEHVERCDECQRDLIRARRVDLPHVRHLSQDDLWAYDLGFCSPAERVYAEMHSRTCAPCAQALAAVAEGEQEIAGLTGVGVPEVLKVNLPRARRGGEEPEVLADDADFRLLLFRRRKRVTVMVQPRGPRLVAAASLDLPGRRIEATPCAEGLEFELDSLPRGRVSLSVRLGRGDGEIVKRIELALKKS